MGQTEEISSVAVALQSKGQAKSSSRPHSGRCPDAQPDQGSTKSLVKLVRWRRRKECVMRRIFITGSTDGLGREAARTLIEEGHQVVLHARSRERAQAVVDLAQRSA